MLIVCLVLFYSGRLRVVFGKLNVRLEVFSKSRVLADAIKIYEVDSTGTSNMANEFEAFVRETLKSLLSDLPTLRN